MNGDFDEMNEDETYMHRCIQLARNGRQNAQPNPMVGAVIVHGGRIIGEGYHVRCGEGHAEVNAFASVKPEDEKFLPEATIYVSLEPCSHYGKTPPCADLIIRKGVKRVVVGCMDPFAKVHGRGVQKLWDAGIEVKVGVCESECRELNKVFMTFHRLQRPYITLKWAQTADGFIGKTDAEGKQHPMAISDEFSKLHSHKLRAENQAILVGRHTLDSDHPSLTTRHWYGPNPKRIVLTHRKDELGGFDGRTDNGEILVLDGNIGEVVRELHEQGIQSLLVEGGACVHQQFIDAGLWDEAYVEQGLMNIGNGTKAPLLPTDESVRVAPKEVFGHTIMHYTNLTHVQ
jgi:diaminohydroxyphosphoribosylaminopyrimidine deaminase / 5-amino-6-(5-phosphoribosylamino)uracil reductase